MNKRVLEKQTKADLMEQAKELNLQGRSRMNKAELIEALLARMKASAPKRQAVPRGIAEKRSVLRSSLGFKVRKQPESFPETLQEEVERSRFELGVEPETPREPFLESAGELPQGYGDDRLVLVVRDPYWLYSYWEIQEGTVQRALEERHLAGHYGQQVLRVYIGGEETFEDVRVEGFLNDWYVNVGRPNQEFFADFGILVGDLFIPLVRSNRVRTPRAGMSEVVDDQWVTLDEEAEKLYALSGGYRMGEGSLELREMMEQRLLGELSSGAVSSFFGSGKFRERARGFWCRLDAELIVYGATEKDAKVTLQGRPISLRPDGTFTARFSLPDGNQEIPVTFVSSDDVDHVTIIPKVSRKTEKT